MYDLELERVVNEIKKQNAKNVLIQLPDGLKPKAKEITDLIEQKAKVPVFIWLTSCYGACDLPTGMENLGVDLIIQWGHNK